MGDALEQMNQEEVKLLMVGDASQILGIVSIGDIQRALIKKTPLDTEIQNIYNQSPIVMNESDSMYQIRKKMFEIRAEYMPILNKMGGVERVVFWKDIDHENKLPSKYKVNVPVVIMAGGKGTRLRPITNVLPKPLIPLGDKPIVETIMDRFVHIGSTTFYLTVNFRAELIKYYFENLNHPDYQIEYVHEDKPLGTAGSLHLLSDTIKSTFFVSNCDIDIDQDYSHIYDFHVKGKFEITLVGVLKKEQISYGVLKTDELGQLTDIEEKPQSSYLINAGVYILEPHLLKEIPKNEFFHITHLIEKVKSRGGKVGVFPVDDNQWKDIGEWDEYLKNKSNA